METNFLQFLYFSLCNLLALPVLLGRLPGEMWVGTMASPTDGPGGAPALAAPSACSAPAVTCLGLASFAHFGLRT